MLDCVVVYITVECNLYQINYLGLGRDSFFFLLSIIRNSVVSGRRSFLLLCGPRKDSAFIVALPRPSI